MAIIREKSRIHYSAQQAKIRRKAAERMREWIERHGTDDRQAMIGYAYDLVDYYGEAAGALAAEQFDQTAEANGKKIAGAIIAATVAYGILARAINGAMKQGEGEVPQVVDRFVKQAAEDTTLQNAARYGAEWAWVPDGDSCDYCDQIAARGWQKASRKMAEGQHAEHIHPNCNCEIMIRFDGSGGVEGYDPKDYEKDEKALIEAGGSGNIDTKVPDQLIITDDQFGKKVGKHAGDFGLDPAIPEDREDFRRIIESIFESYDEIREAEWRGYNEPVLFYVKGDDVLVIKQDGTFISVLEGGINNERVKNARRREI